MTEKKDDYLKALEASRDETIAYYKRYVVKSEQQKFLEQLLDSTSRSFDKIADIACGGGTLTWHLKNKYPNASFTLCDYNEDGLEIAQELNGSEHCTYLKANLYSLPLPNNHFDLVCCWQTLSWLDEPEKALNALIRITKPGGLIMASSLFNLNHDVDIYAKVLDHTRPSGELHLPYSYNTYSAKSVQNWTKGKVNKITLHRFVPEIDFRHDGRGLGTFTVTSEIGRLQISGGYLMNWAVLEMEK
jgi:Methylase involved in ubiquinone/menaquinone biosynthesis